MIMCKVIIYVTNAIIVIPNGILVEFENGQCQEKSISDAVNLNYFYGIFTFLFTYFVPCLLFFILYRRIIYDLCKRQADDSNLGQSKIINQATNQLTKSAVLVTIIYILTIRPNVLLYVLASLGALAVPNRFCWTKGNSVSHSTKLMSLWYTSVFYLLSDKTSLNYLGKPRGRTSLAQL